MAEVTNANYFMTIGDKVKVETSFVSNGVNYHQTRHGEIIAKLGDLF